MWNGKGLVMDTAGCSGAARCALTKGRAMAFDPYKHHRRSIRLKGYDYAQASIYFVTIRVQGRQNLFGYILDGQMIPNPVGQMVIDLWTSLSQKRRTWPSIGLDTVQLGSSLARTSLPGQAELLFS
jgi:hypothetical protein